MPSSHQRYAEWAATFCPNAEGLAIAIQADRPHTEQTYLGLRRLFDGMSLILLKPATCDVRHYGEYAAD